MHLSGVSADEVRNVVTAHRRYVLSTRHSHSSHTTFCYPLMRCVRSHARTGTRRTSSSRTDTISGRCHNLSEFEISGENADTCGQRSLLHDASPEQLMALGVSEGAARGVRGTSSRGGAQAHESAGSSSQHAQASSSMHANDAWAHEDFDANWEDEDGGADEVQEDEQPRTEEAAVDASASTSTTKKVPNLPTPNPPPLHIGGSSHGRRPRARPGTASDSIACAIEGMGNSLVSAIAESMAEQRRMLQEQQQQADRLAQAERAHQLQLASQCRTQ